jgi:LmbE family N-acetylglucosaminyl deacetylase
MSQDATVVPDAGIRPDVERILVVTAHPDDVDFGSAGTIARWTDAGIAVTYCVATDGDAGGFDPAVARENIPAIRRAEQEAAAKAVGVLDVRFLGYRDGRLEPSYDLRRDITRVIREIRPQRVLMQSPERNWIRIAASHPDHLAVGEATIRAVYPDARNPFAHAELLQDEGLEPWTVPEVWVVAGPGSNQFVDVTDTFDRKIAALRAHVSQTEHMTELEPMVRSWLARNATAAGLPEGRLAESYQIHETG